MKKKKNDQKNFEFGQVMSMLENMDDGIRLISEQHSEVVERLDGIDTRLDKMDGRMDKMDGRMDKMDGRMDKMDGKIDKMDGKIDKMQDDITEIKYRLTEKVDRDEFEKLEKRMIRIEKLVFKNA